MASQRHGARPSDITQASDSRASSRLLDDFVLGPFVEESVSSDVCNSTGTLMGKTGERESLSHVQDFLAVNFISKEWVLCGVSRRTVGRGQRL